ncbi:MAG: hypothetical protein ACKESB_02000 [Candidatus Hodgkinia cicadicola]
MRSIAREGGKRVAGGGFAPNLANGDHLSPPLPSKKERKRGTQRDEGVAEGGGRGGREDGNATNDPPPPHIQGLNLQPPQAAAPPCFCLAAPLLSTDEASIAHMAKYG